MAERFEEMATIERGYVEWRSLIAEVPVERMAEPGDSGEWSVKDIVAHVAWYEWWTAEFVRTKTWPAMPAHLDLADMNARNDAYYAERKNDPAAQILEEADCWHAGLIASLAAVTEAEWADSTLLGMPPGDEWQLATLVAENTFRHYAAHMPAIRAWIDKNAIRP